MMTRIGGALKEIAAELPLIFPVHPRTRGMLGAINRFLPDGGFLDPAMRGGMSLGKRDIEGITTLLVDAEMKMFQGLKTPVIFL